MLRIQQESERLSKRRKLKLTQGAGKNPIELQLDEKRIEKQEVPGVAPDKSSGKELTLGLQESQGYMDE